MLSPAGRGRAPVSAWLGSGARLRRDRSMLADAQRRFNAAAGEDAMTMEQGRWCGRPPGEVELTLVTHEARALYEGGVVPVREIARLCGVSVRTLYHHVHARGWRRRRSSVPRDGAKSARQRARYVAAKSLRPPMSRGLKARDPAGQARALEGARRAAELAGEALAKAIARQDAESQTRMLVMVERAMRDLAIAGGVVDVRGRQIGAKRTGEARKGTKPRRRPYQWRPMYVPP